MADLENLEETWRTNPETDEDEDKEKSDPEVEDEEEFHSLMEDALMEDLEETPTEIRTPPEGDELALALTDLEMTSPEDSEAEAPIVDPGPSPSPEVATPTQPPVEFQRFALPKPGPSIPSPICSKPAPFVLKPSKLDPEKHARNLASLEKERLEMLAKKKEKEKEKEKEKSTFSLKNPFARSTRSNTQIQGDPTREYLPTRTSRKN